MQGVMAERTTVCNKQHDGVAQLIYLYLSKHEFFRHFTVKKTRAPFTAAGVFPLTFLVNFFMLILPEKKKIPHGNITPAFH